MQAEAARPRTDAERFQLPFNEQPAFGAHAIADPLDLRPFR